MKSIDILDENLVKRPAPVSLLLLAVVPLLLGPLLGVVTNFINGCVSEEYFEILMGWDFDYISTSTLAVLQGAFEGFIYGAVFSLVFTVFVAKTNRKELGRKYYGSAFIRVIVIVLVGWLLGGLFGLILYSQVPEFGPDILNSAIIWEIYLRERYGWVAGSIWGGMIGGVMALTWAIYTTSRHGKKLKRYDGI